MTKQEKQRRKLKTHTEKEAFPQFKNYDWSRASDGKTDVYGSAKKILDNIINDQFMISLNQKSV